MKHQHNNILTKNFSLFCGMCFSREEVWQNQFSVGLVRSMGILLFLLAPLIWGCETGDGNSAVAPDHIHEMDQVSIYSEEDIASADTLILTREQTFGDTDDLIMGNPGRFVVDGNGTIYIGDMQQNSIHIFREDGSYATSFGREGDGPGEFRWIGLIFLQSNDLYVFDPNMRRVNVFSIVSGVNTIPEFSHTINLPGENWDDLSQDGHMFPSLHSVRSDGSLLVSLMFSPLNYRENPEVRGTTRYYATDNKGENVTGKVFEIDMPEHIVTEWFTIPPPFNPSGLVALSSQGQILSAWTDEFLIKVHDPDGIYQHAIYYPFSKRALTSTEAINSVDDHEQLHNAVRGMQLPETWPALSRMFVDDEDRIWVSTIIDSDDVYQWWVMDTTGDLLARFEWSRNRSIDVVKNGNMYTRETDEQTGLRQVVRYRIDFTEK